MASEQVIDIRLAGRHVREKESAPPKQRTEGGTTWKRMLLSPLRALGTRAGARNDQQETMQIGPRHSADEKTRSSERTAPADTLAGITTHDESPQLIEHPPETGQTEDTDRILFEAVQKRFKIAHPDKDFPWDDTEFVARLDSVRGQLNVVDDDESPNTDLIITTLRRGATDSRKVEELKDRVNAEVDRLFNLLNPPQEQE